jgi:hypothetical protein
MRGRCPISWATAGRAGTRLRWDGAERRDAISKVGFATGSFDEKWTMIRPTIRVANPIKADASIPFIGPLLV